MPDHLPDDPRRWPDNPFQLLGVELPATETDLKRAYTRLIRRFKPERHPEEFRRIREAYETALQHAKWFGFLPQPNPAPSPTPDQPRDAEPEPMPDAVVPRELEREQPRRPVPRDPVEEAWAFAASGETDKAYSRLLELDHARPDNTDLPLRLYWLLSVHPALDEERSRHDWLATALKRSHLMGPAVELYQCELAANAESCLFGPYLRLLETDAPAHAKLVIARHRLAPAGLNRFWRILDCDIEALGNRATEFEESSWLWYLVAAMGYAGFDCPNPAYSRCVDLFGGLRHLELSHGWAFDQEEQQRVMVWNWRKSVGMPASILEVIRDAWAGTGESWRPAMNRAGAWAAEDPVAVLRKFDAATHHGENGLLLNTFARLVSESPRPAPLSFPPGLIRALTRDFLSARQKSYTALRPDLLQFLLDESIDPEELAQACGVDPTYYIRSLSAHVRNDAVLRVVWQLATAA